MTLISDFSGELFVLLQDLNPWELSVFAKGCLDRIPDDAVYSVKEYAKAALDRSNSCPGEPSFVTAYTLAAWEVMLAKYNKVSVQPVLEKQLAHALRLREEDTSNKLIFANREWFIARGTDPERFGYRMIGVTNTSYYEDLIDTSVIFTQDEIKSFDPWLNEYIYVGRGYNKPSLEDAKRALAEYNAREDEKRKNRGAQIADSFKELIKNGGRME